MKTAGLAQSEKDKHLKLPDAHYGYGFIQPGPALRRDIAEGPAQGPLPMPQGKALRRPSSPAPTRATTPTRPWAARRG